MIAPRSPLTFEVLLDHVRRKSEGARAPTSKAGWQLLEQAVAALAGGDPDDGLLSGRPWELIEVRVEDYQGVRSMEPLRFDPTPGVTVLRGDNGSGKSSLAEAIDTGLRGRPRPRVDGSGGRAPLWDRDHVASGAPGASVAVVLARGTERLELVTGLDDAGGVSERRAVHRSVDRTVEVDLDSVPWASALAGFPPVFAYAAVERRVQLARDLQEFLAPMLALGGCFDELETRLAAGAEAPLTAEQRWTDRLEQARTEVARVDSLYDDGSTPPALRWPVVDEDPDVWVREHDLQESGEHVPPITGGHGHRLRSAVDGTVEALGSLEAAEGTALARIAGPLRDLHARAVALEDAGDRCPVCATPVDDWRGALGTSLDGLDDLGAREDDFARALGLLRDRLDEELAQIAQVVDRSWFDADRAADAAQVRSSADELRSAVGRDGLHSTPDVRAAVRAVAVGIRSESWGRVVDEAVQRGDHRRQWSRARRAAFEPMLAVWRVDGPDAAAAVTWRAAKTCLRSLQAELQDVRAVELEERADNAVRRLLSDVGLGIERMRIQKTKATVRVVDAAGRPMELSMLSAGQRNALLLAPLLAVAQQGPFAFLVLDDPVHAFDDVRVDQLARTIAALASTRRVVVFTHDDRLREHLAAVAPECGVHEVTRDHATGAVRHDRSDPAWRVLLDDAVRALDLSRHFKHDGVATPTDLVRGFCRMAVDAALRQYVMIAASAGGSRDVHADLAELDGDKVHTTADRFGVVRAMHPCPAVEEAWQVFEPHKLDWNMAVHGNVPTSPVDRREIQDAERIGTLLGGTGT